MKIWNINGEHIKISKEHLLDLDILSNYYNENKDKILL
jgi:hypothetical protein